MVVGLPAVVISRPKALHVKRGLAMSQSPVRCDTHGREWLVYGHVTPTPHTLAFIIAIAYSYLFVPVE